MLDEKYQIKILEKRITNLEEDTAKKIEDLYDRMVRLELLILDKE
jgi:hypothetical protein